MKSGHENQSLSGSLFLFALGIGSIPNSGIPVASSRHHDGSHDGGNIEGRPLGHEAVEKNLLIHPLIALLLHLILHWHSPRVVDGVGLVPVVVGLHQEPIRV